MKFKKIEEGKEEGVRRDIPPFILKNVENFYRLAKERYDELLHLANNDQTGFNKRFGELEKASGSFSANIPDGYDIEHAKRISDGFVVAIVKNNRGERRLVLLQDLKSDIGFAYKSWLELQQGQGNVDKWNPYKYTESLGEILTPKTNN